MFLKMTDITKQELRFKFRRFISFAEIQVQINVKNLASVICKLNILRVQVREASIYLKLMDSAKTKELKNKEQKQNMILPIEIQQELYCQQGVIVRNQEMILEVRIPEAVMVSNSSPKGWGVTLELQTGDTLAEHGEWNREQKYCTSNMKEMEAIYLGLFCFGQIFKVLQIKAILIRSDSSTAVQYLAKQSAGQTLVAEVKKIVKLCQQLRILIQTQHIPGISNKITDALSRLSTQGDYTVKKEIFRALCQIWQTIPTLDLFATGENKLVDRFMAIGEEEEEEEEELLNEFQRPWMEQIFWIHPPIPKIGKALIAWEKLEPKSFMKEPWQPGQIWFIHLLTGSSRYLFTWRELSDSKPGEGDDEKEGYITSRKNHGIPYGLRVEQGRKILTEFLDNINMARENQQLIIEEQKNNIQQKYILILGVFDD
ncbi:MAG: hypothetical protein EZS28_006931 [Streblomastix strix]|uniref:RNase H type-1 domain-containing protein n=1 Tax=Streblomastix strix TaxID=222440 RepID=A0A5J4WTU0_9EUKA|nr:MAG: hypothetical protein EZS28_006931 [Streblomastix strix]